MLPATEKAYLAWRRAADRGYGERDNTSAHMIKVDARIRKLKERYEKLLVAEVELVFEDLGLTLL